jgi:uncharacterized protein
MIALSSHQPYRVMGIDLSGPANHADTCMAWRNAKGQIQFECDCSDEAIVNWVAVQPEPLLVLIDAPLSYQDGGGYRPCDGQLRAWLNQAGFHRLGVMAPTMTKMVYLTLRGISLAHQLRQQGALVMETHPGASLVLSGVDTQSVYNLKKEQKAKDLILEHWQKLGHHFTTSPSNDHQMMAIQALLTGERWLNQQAYYWRCEDWIV